jgi:DNA-binding NtrC family response regulator
MADGRKLVIIVDDDQAVRELLQFALRLEGLCVHAHSGGAALLADPDLNRARAVAAGVRSVLEKPLLDNVLIDNIRAILSPAAGLPKADAT